MTQAPRAVVDIGSNSARLLVVRPTDQGHLDVVADARVALRLVRELDASGRLTRAATAHTVQTLHAFSAIARRHGARDLAAVATAAVRDAANRESFLAEVSRRTGVTLRLLSGEDEARLALLGAVAALPVESGVVADLGGGSLELAAFSRRRFRSGVTLPLGALRLSDAHLGHDPPRGDEVEALAAEARERLSAIADVDLTAGAPLVGTGGTIRALAKAAGGTSGAVSRLHGFELRRDHVDALATRLVGLPARQREQIAGISATRAESVVGGALVVQVLMEVAGAASLLVSGYGVRQGVVLEQLDLGAQRPRAVREASVSAVLSRLRGGNAGPQRRRLLLTALAPVLAPGMDAALLDGASHAARLVDAGEHLDHYGRWEEAAKLVTTADLDGFSHAELATIAAVLLRAGNRVLPATVRRASGRTRADIERAAVLVALADDLDARLPRGRAASVGALGKDGRLDVTGMPAMLLPPDLRQRCRGVLRHDVREVADLHHPHRRADRPGIAVEFK
ncbi:MAG: Ppx/GppA phosphatase family protein [Candidatus Dormibacteria bacterium]